MNKPMKKKPEERSCAESFLYQAWDAHNQVTRDGERLARLEAIATQTTIVLQQDRVQTSARSDRMEQAILEAEEAREDMIKHRDNEVEAALKIAHLIELLDNETFRRILENRYLRYMEWKNIEIAMSYNKSWVRRLHRRALLQVEKLLEEMGHRA